MNGMYAMEDLAGLIDEAKRGNTAQTPHIGT